MGDLALNMAVGGVSSGAACVFTNPLDVLKTDIQMRAKMQRTMSATPAQNVGITGLMASRIQARGFTSYWDGMNSAFMRALSYSAIRLGAYGPIKVAIDGAPIGSSKIAAGLMSGTLAAAVANPIEIVKTRMQADAAKYNNSTFRAFSSLIREEGFIGLTNGLVPHCVRGATVTASQLATYDTAKRAASEHFGLQDGLVLRFAASMISGVVTTTVVAPVDLIKTRVMTSSGSDAGVLKQCRAVLKTDGPLGFFKGWVPGYLRMGPQTVITFMIYEQLRSIFGLGAM